jgi:methionine-rich copper-binding protein CopC
MNKSHTVEWRLWPALLAAFVAGMLLLIPPAALVSAHAAPESSVPADGEVVAESPAQIKVIFKQEIARSGGLPTLEVVSEEGELVSSNAILNDDDRTEMTADLNPGLPDGRYSVIWHTLSADDGEDATGAFFFYVGEGPSATTPTTGGSATATMRPTATPAPAAKDDDGGDIPVWALIAGVIGGLVVGGGGGLLVGRRN